MAQMKSHLGKKKLFFFLSVIHTATIRDDKQYPKFSCEATNSTNAHKTNVEEKLKKNEYHPYIIQSSLWNGKWKYTSKQQRIKKKHSEKKRKRIEHKYKIKIKYVLINVSACLKVR